MSYANFVSTRLLTLRSRLSAASGVNVPGLVQGPGFLLESHIREQDFEAVSLDIHQIFHKVWCEDRGIKPAIFNSIINKTPISYNANRMKDQADWPPPPISSPSRATSRWAFPKTR